MSCLGRLRIRLKKNKTKSRRKGGFFSWETRKNEEKREVNNAGEGYAGLRQQAKQASPRRVGAPIPHPDAIEIKTLPEQIIKVLALHIDKGGAAGGETPPLRCNARICRQ